MSDYPNVESSGNAAVPSKLASGSIHEENRPVLTSEWDSTAGKSWQLFCQENETLLFAIAGKKTILKTQYNHATVQLKPGEGNFSASSQ